MERYCLSIGGVVIVEENTTLQVTQKSSPAAWIFFFDTHLDHCNQGTVGERGHIPSLPHPTFFMLSAALFYFW